MGAKLLGLEAQSVQLAKKRGEVLKSPVAKLSQADRDYFSTSDRKLRRGYLLEVITNKVAPTQNNDS